MAVPIVSAAYVALFFYYVYANVIVEPYWDMFSIVTRFLQYERDGNLWAYLWEPHVQHRQIWMRLLTAFDARAFGGVGYPFVAVAVVCQVTSGWLAWRLARRGAEGGEGTLLACLSVMLVLTSVSAVICATPMNGIYPQALVGCLLAISIFSQDDAGQTGVWGALRRILGIGAAMGAAFGNAAALSLWPILAWLAWKGGARRAWVVTVVLTGVVFSAFYVYGLPRSGVGDGEGATGASLVRMADYLVTYLGLPWTRAAALAVPGKMLGAALLVAAVVAGAAGLARKVPARLDRAALALVAFTLATALLAAVGRSSLDDPRVPVRYSVFVAPLHLGLLWLAWPRLSLWLASLGRRRVLQVASLLVAVALTAQQYASGQAAVATTAAMRSVLARFAAGEATDEMRAVVFDDLGQARRDLDAIHAAGLYLTTP